VPRRRAPKVRDLAGDPEAADAVFEELADAGEELGDGEDAARERDARNGIQTGDATPLELLLPPRNLLSVKMRRE